MLRKAIYTLLLLPLLAGSCEKKSSESQRCSVFTKYSDEQEYVPIEEAYCSWEQGTAHLNAEGIDHEMLKLYLQNVSKTGTYPLTTEDISFSDGLDFDSQKLIEGTVTITSVNGEEISGSFKALLFDNVNGTEERWLEGNFTIANR